MHLQIDPWYSLQATIKKKLLEAGNQGNASVDDAYRDTEVILRADERERKFKIAHDFVGMTMILNFKYKRSHWMILNWKVAKSDIFKNDPSSNVWKLDFRIDLKWKQED